jgi:hypothetical protein
VYSQENEVKISNRHLQVHVYCSTLHNSQEIEKPIYPPTEEWVDEENVIHMYHRILFSHKKMRSYSQQHGLNWRSLC